jgi:ubiquinone/menaquinone biosynthesis C-methylase UbiE
MFVISPNQINMPLRQWALSNLHNRDKFVHSWLEKLPAGSTILDAGAGVQRYKEKAQSCSLHYTSQDFGNYTGGETFGSKSVGQWNSQTCDIVSDITCIPIDDNSFDFVMCTEVFEHLPSPELALEELTRLLKPGGTLLITAPFRCLYHQDPYFFYSGFSKYWYEHFCKNCKLEIQSLMPNGNYYTDLAQEIARTTSFGKAWLRLLTKIISFPMLIQLYLMDKTFKTKSPESCWGYHLVAQKL